MMSLVKEPVHRVSVNEEGRQHCDHCVLVWLYKLSKMWLGAVLHKLAIK